MAIKKSELYSPLWAGAVMNLEAEWMQTIKTVIKGEIDHISQRLTNHIKELAERYETPLPKIDKEVESLEAKVNAHFTQMGFVL